MAKQDDYIRTQVRMDNATHSWLKEYANTNNISLNQAINNLVDNGLHHNMNIEDNQNNRQLWKSIVTTRMDEMSSDALLQLCNLSALLSKR